ncbi:MAG: hypothetical protein AB1631_30540 [Acidobacteriota bacterium]
MSFMGHISTESKRTDYEIPAAAFYIVLTISAVLLALGVVWRLYWASSTNARTAATATIAIGLAGLCSYLFLAQYRLLIEEWISDNSFLLEESSSRRDLRGKRSTGQPYAISECTVLARIDLIETIDANKRRAAIESLPDALWPRAINALLKSKQPDGRIAAVRLSNIPRRAVVKVCLKDPDASARKVAWEKIASDLSPREARQLSKAIHEDARSFAVGSGKLSRRLLLRRCRRDKHPNVRAIAWEQIEERLTSAEAARLLKSRHEDARRRALHSGLLPRRLLARSCSKDKDSSLRRAAWEMLRDDLTRSEATGLSRSRHGQTRSWAVASGRLTGWRLFWMSISDQDSSVSKSAREQRRARSRAKRSH